jgi:hypothetical protein
MKYIDVTKLKAGMVCGETATLSPFAVVERITINGIFNAFSNLSTHICMVADVGQGVLQWIEMAPPTIRSKPLSEYDNGAWGEHIVFVGDPFAGKSEGDRMRANDWLLHSWSLRINYNIEELFRFWDDTLPDDQSKIVCSDLPRNMYRYMQMDYPHEWDDLCSPYNWQAWDGLYKLDNWRLH